MINEFNSNVTSQFVDVANTNFDVSTTVVIQDTTSGDGDKSSVKHNIVLLVLKFQGYVLTLILN